jgi:hypothetical protein
VAHEYGTPNGGPADATVADPAAGG